ncbi:MAG: HD-GYP domain-containing protein [Thermomicrobiales bacterium]
MIPVRARVALVAFGACVAIVFGATVSAESLFRTNLSSISVALALLLLLVVIEHLDISLPVGAGTFTFSVSAPIMVAAPIHFGVVEGCLIVLTGLVIDEVQHRRSLIKSSANVFTYLLATSLAGLTYTSFADLSASPIGTPFNLASALAAGLVFSQIGSWCMAFIVAPAIGSTPLSLWRSNFLASIVEWISVPTLGGLTVVLAEENAIAVVLLLLPLLAPQLAYRTLQRAQGNIRDTIESLADAIERRDRYTANHSTRVAGYTRAMLAELSDIPDHLSQTIIAAARVHDVGKVGIKDSTLLKPGPLTTEERLDLQMHTVVGAEIVSRITDYRLCAAIIRHHHERWDGAGYPDGLSGEDIPVGSRIIGVADAFDAMTSDRPYRRAMSAEAAIEEVRRNSGSQFDPRIVTAFEHVMSFTPRTQPELATAQFQHVNPTLVG